MSDPTPTDDSEPRYSQADLDLLGGIWLRQVRDLTKERDDALALAAAVIAVHGGETRIASKMIRPEHATMRPVKLPCAIKGVERWGSEKIMLASSLVESPS